MEGVDVLGSLGTLLAREFEETSEGPVGKAGLGSIYLREIAGGDKGVGGGVRGEVG